jgi:hypothetical protein
VHALAAALTTHFLFPNWHLDLVATASVSVFYALLVALFIPMFFLLLLSCPGAKRLFEKMNVKRRTSKHVMFGCGIVIGFIFLTLFLVRAI